jgi:hypothetical protein
MSDRDSLRKGLEEAAEGSLLVPGVAIRRN